MTIVIEGQDGRCRCNDEHREKGKFAGAGSVVGGGYSQLRALLDSDVDGSSKAEYLAAIFNLVGVISAISPQVDADSG